MDLPAVSGNVNTEQTLLSLNILSDLQAALQESPLVPSVGIWQRQT